MPYIILILVVFFAPISYAQIGPDGTGTINGITIGPGLDLSGQDLQGFNLYDANLRGIDFTDADLSNAVLDFADCTDAIFTNANLSGASFIEANLTGANLVNVNLQGAILRASNLKDCDISGANLEGANLSGATLNNVKGQNLSGNAIVPYGYLIIHGYLVGPSVNLSQANLEETDFRNLDLSGATFYEAKLSGSNFMGANLNGAKLLFAELSNALFSNASFLIEPGNNPLLAVADLTWTRFDDSDLTGADFSFCVLDTTSMFGADLSGAKFTGVIIGNTTFNDTVWSNVKTISEYTQLELEKSIAVSQKNSAIAEKNIAENERDQAFEERDQAISERDSRYSRDQFRDLREGSTLIEVNDGNVILSVGIEESADLIDWEKAHLADFEIPFNASLGSMFYRTMFGSSQQENSNNILNDSDGDTLLDIDEIEIYKTNPNLSDSDLDGVSDGIEVRFDYTDPKDINSFSVNGIGLVSVYSFNENTFDYSGNEYHLNHQGELSFENSFNDGKAILLNDPSDGLISESTIDNLSTGPHSFGVWFKQLDSLGSQILLGLGQPDLIRSYLQLVDGKVYVAHGMEKNGGRYEFTEVSDYQIDVDTWNHLIMAVQGNDGTIKVFLNGSLLGQVNAGINLVSPSDLHVGAIASLPADDQWRQGFNGLIDQARIYNRFLDDADAVVLFESEATDSDKDGVFDIFDVFPNDPTETTDSDGDGVGDNADAFPNDPAETTDSDDDGVGDNADAFPNDPAETTDSDDDGVGDNADPFPYESLELHALGSSGFQPKENVGWIEVSVATLSNGYEMPGIWHPIEDDLAIWFAFDGSWSYEDIYSWDRQNQTSTGPTGNVGQWVHYSTVNPNLYTCRFDWSHGTSGYGFTYDGRIDLDNDGIQDRIQIRSGLKFPAEGSQIDFDVILNSLSANLGLFLLPPNFTEDDYDGDGVDDDLDAFPNDPNETTDSDGDGVGDNADAFPNDSTETVDSDRDGVGDNADPFPYDPSRPSSYQFDFDNYLVAHYPLLSDFQDYSGNSNHLNPIGSPQFRNNAVDFDGEDDFIYSDDRLFDSYPFTWSGWFKINNFDPSLEYVFFEQSGGLKTSPYAGYQNAIFGPVLSFYTYDNNGHAVNIPIDLLNLTDWSHYAFVAKEDGRKEVYINGALINTNNSSASFGQLLNQFSMGGIYGYDTAHAYQAKEVRLYEIALTQSEINELINSKDMDQDGLSDGDEVNIHYTNPNNSDSDGDGVNDNIDPYPNNAENTPLSSNLILYYPLNGNILDYSGNDNHLTPITSSSHSFVDNGIVGSALSQDGISDGLQTSLSFSNPESFTVSLWINSSDDSGRLIAKEWGNGPWLIDKLNDEIIFEIIPENRVGSETVSTSYPISDGWNHIAITYSNESYKSTLYVNGVSRGSFFRQMDQSKLFAGNPLKIGGVTQSSERLEGLTDEVKLYNRVLSPNEIKHAYSTYAPRYQIIEGDFGDINNAKSDALSRGGRLAVLDTIEKINSASSFLEDNGIWPEMWIGLEYDASDSKWRWSNGNDLVHERWYSGEPNNLSEGEYFTHYRTSQYEVWHTWNNTRQVDNHVTAYLLETGGNVRSPDLDLDTDGDGIFDNVDSDDVNDGLLDIVETNTGIWVDINNTGTDPKIADSDGDGLSDREELSFFSTPYEIVYGSYTYTEALLDAVDKGGYVARTREIDEFAKLNRYLKTVSLDEIGSYSINRDGAPTGAHRLWFSANYSDAQNRWEWHPRPPGPLHNGEEPGHTLIWDLGYEEWLNVGNQTAVMLDHLKDDELSYLGISRSEFPYDWYWDSQFENEKYCYILERDVQRQIFEGKNSDPNNADTDGDGLSDSFELGNGMDPNLNFVSDKLLAHYTFENSFEDVSGNARHLNTQGTPTFVDSFNGSKAVQFDDPSEALFVNNVLGPVASSSHSLSLWFYTDLEEANGLLAKHSYNVRSGLSLSNGRLGYTHGGNGFMESGSVSDFDSGSWNHLVMTVSGNNGIIKLFLNGNYIGSFASGVNEISNNGISIGATAEVPYYDPYRAPFVGKIDNVRYYDSQLSDSEAIQLYNLERPEYAIIGGDYTWTEAKLKAKSRGGHLAILDTPSAIADANSFLESQSNWPELWIGLEKVSDEWLWVDNTNLSDSNWGTNQPDNDLNSEQYVLLLGSHQNEPSKWNDAQPSHKASLLIQNEDRVLLPLIEYSSQFTLVNGQYTYEEAKLDAINKGGRLAVIDSESKSNQVLEVLTNNIEVWRNNDFWIGLSDKIEEGVWKWVNGKSLTFSNWYGTEPNDGNPSNSEDAVTILRYRDDISPPHALGEWNDLDEGSINSYLLEILEPIPSNLSDVNLGLVSHYDFSGLDPLSGSGSDLTLYNNAQIINDPIKGEVLRIQTNENQAGNYYGNVFDTPGGYALVDGALDDIDNNGDTDYSFSISFKLEETHVHPGGSIVNHGINGSNYEKGLIGYRELEGGDNVMYLFTQVDEYNYLGELEPVMNSWVHYVMTVENDTVRLYINGNEISEYPGGTYWDSSMSVGEQLLLGKSIWDNAASTRISACYDDLKVFNRALSAEEVTVLYNENIKSNLSLGLLAHYQFMDGFSDASIHAQDALSTNVTINADGAAYFSGDSYLDLPFELSDYASATFSTWLRSEDLSGIQGIISQPRSSIGTGFALGLVGDSPSAPKFNVSYLNDSFSLFESMNVALDPALLNTWVHLAATIDGANSKEIKLYLNGSLIATEPIAESNGVTDVNLLIGKELHDEHWSHNGVRYLKGNLDEVRIYDRPLNAEEIEYIALNLDSDLDGISDFEELTLHSTDLNENGSEYFTYTIENGEVTITGYNGSETTVLIPSSIESKPVTKIGFRAFSWRNDISKVILPTTAKMIEDQAFRECLSLQAIVLPEGLERIGDTAFGKCASLASVSIPQSVIEIQPYAFSRCYDLVSVVIPENVNQMGRSVFFDCTNLETVDFYNNLPALPEYTFEACSSLKFVRVFTDTLADPNSNAFTGCDALISVTNQ